MLLSQTGQAAVDKSSRILFHRPKRILNCTNPVPAALSRLAEITLQLRNMLLLGSVTNKKPMLKFFTTAAAF
jgi:hypothetical protein